MTGDTVVTGPGRDWQTIELETAGPVGYLRFNRPERRNGVTVAMVGEVHQALRWVAAQPQLDVLVLTGNGPTFCPGADLSRDRDPAPGGPALVSRPSPTRRPTTRPSCCTPCRR